MHQVQFFNNGISGKREVDSLYLARKPYRHGETIKLPNDTVR